ncbi:MAG TPA: FAD:protein FMN transferase [Saprospiraceae bacterium]|nr:FAD:protein FMN transferase [Saprospiraceae bacterium]HMQ84508.1 FAD:protein FMN transferase [Saprospiraceae bacterium]
MKASPLYHLLWVFFLAACSGQPQKENAPYLSCNGRTMGTTYTVKYADAAARDFQTAIDSLLEEINLEVSTYIEASTISRLNQADSLFLPGYDPHTGQWTTYANTHFWINYEKAKEVFERSGGSFDPTVMPIVNYWGFGYTEKKPVEKIDSLKIDSLMDFIGLDQVVSTDGKQIKKRYPGVQLDFSALAKGYGVDAVGLLLESKGVSDYLVEIGGELRAKGKNAEGAWWNVGINTPQEDASTTAVQMAFPLQNQSIATSGNYRNFYEVKGQKFSHTINPKTGFPERSTLLSASVFAPDCMSADAYATAFMVMGKDKALPLAEELPGIEAYFIYSDDAGNMRTAYTSGLKDYFEK